MLKGIDKLKLKHFKAMAKLEAQYYTSDYITDYEDAYDFYVYSQDTCKAIANQDRVVGFMNLFPISKRYEALLLNPNQENQLEHAIGLEDVLRMSIDQVPEFTLFLSCVVVDGPYREMGVLDMLLADYVDLYNQYRTQGCHIGKVITHNVTEAGVRFSERMGFNLHHITKEGTWVYSTDFESFAQKSQLRRLHL